MADIEELLNEGPATSEETVAEQVIEQVEEQPQPRDEGGKFAPKGEESASPAPVEEPPLEHPALLGERKRRQAAEDERNALKEQLEQMQKPAEPTPNMWEDDEAWQQHFGKNLVGQAVTQATQQSTIKMSEMMMRQNFPDFEEMREKYIALERENPAIIPQVMNDPHPWKKAYDIAKNHTAMQDLGATNIEDMKAKLREELMAEMAANTPATRQGLPPTLSSERNVGERTGPAWSGPKPLDELLK